MFTALLMLVALAFSPAEVEACSAAIGQVVTVDVSAGTVSGALVASPSTAPADEAEGRRGASVWRG